MKLKQKLFIHKIHQYYYFGKCLLYDFDYGADCQCKSYVKPIIGINRPLPPAHKEWVGAGQSSVGLFIRKIEMEESLNIT